MDVLNVVNRLVGVKGNLLKIRFSIDDEYFETLVPDDQLFIAVKDVLLNREYEYLDDFELINFRGCRILDVGAQVGLFSILASHFAKEVVSLEPHPINFRLLEINRILNNAKNIYPINKGFDVKTFHPPLVKTNGSYNVQLDGYKTLKIARKIIYSLATLMRKKDKSLAILFAQRG